MNRLSTLLSAFGVILALAAGTGTLPAVSSSAQAADAYSWTNFVGQPGELGGSDGAGTIATFNSPSGVAVDNAGNVYVADTGNHTIRMVTPAGLVTTLAGSLGVSGSDDGAGSGATFCFPQGVAVDNAGNVYVADTGNHTIRRVTSAGLVTTLAGVAGFSGSDDGIGSAATFCSPQGVAVDNAGNVYVADTGNHTIRLVTSAGLVTTLAGLAGFCGSDDGTGAAARFNQPEGVAVDTAGDLYVADTANCTIRQVTSTGVVTTLAGLAGAAGAADGTGIAAAFNYPGGLAVDSEGTIYVADTLNSTIRQVTPAGAVTTIGGLPGLSGTADGIGSAAGFAFPQGIAAGGAGSLYLADSANCRISRAIPADRPAITTANPLPGGTVGTTYTQLFAAIAGTTPYTFTVSSGTLPAGLSLSSDGILTGTPAEAAAVTFTLQVTGDDGLSSTKSFTVTIVPPPSITTSSPLSGGTVGEAYCQTFEAAGGLAPYTWSIASGSLPAGMSLFNDGTLTGIPGQATTVTFSVQVMDANGATGTGSFSLTIVPPPLSIATTSPLLDGILGTPYSQALTATGGVPPYAWSVTSGSLPPGLSLDEDGLISGTPSAIVTASFTVDVVDSESTLRTRTFSLAIGCTYAWTHFVGPCGGFGNADGTGRAARFNRPFGAAVDAAGNVYVADNGNDTIRQVTSAGVVTTLAGKPGTFGTADGMGSAARFAGPNAVAVDAGGNVFVADGSNTIRKITPAGVVTTLAGSPEFGGSADGTGSDARFNNPGGIAVDAAGTVYVADTNNQTIRRITPAGVVTTFAGAAGSAGSVDATGSAARFYLPHGVAVDAAANVYVVDTGNCTIRKITPAGAVTTLAGSAGIRGSADGIGSAALFYGPTSVAVGPAGDLYVADPWSYTIRKISLAGVVTTVAGSAGAYGSADGTGSAARFALPNGVAADGAGNVYVADANNSTVRKITPSGVVTTLAGSAGATGSADGTGLDARFNEPHGAAVDGAGNLYITDLANSTIREVSPAGVVTTLAGSVLSPGSTDGTGTGARFYYPAGIAADATGNAYVADSGNDTIRGITPAGVVTTLAGTAGSGGATDAAGAAARFCCPFGVAVDTAGNIYVADTDNQTIRRMTPAGVVTTVAGTAGVTGSTDGTGSAARFALPYGVAVDAAGNLYVADSLNNTVRKITPAGVVTTLAGLAIVAGSADGVGGAARFSYPWGVAADSVGNVYVTDSNNCTIRKVTPAGAVTTIGGTPGVMGGVDGIGGSANFCCPAGIALDAAGHLYVVDRVNNRIVKGTPIAAAPAIPAGAAPTDGRLDLPVSTTLSWNAGAPGTTFDLYLDVVNPPAVKVVSGLSAASFAPSLIPATRYYWKVVASNPAGQTAGPVWSFATHLPADINGDGYVNVQDLLGLVTAWATHDGSAPSTNWNTRADLNNDGYVNVGDLQILIAHWGSHV